jgi:hypothetical protein
MVEKTTLIACKKQAQTHRIHPFCIWYWMFAPSRSGRLRKISPPKRHHPSAEAHPSKFHPPLTQRNSVFCRSIHCAKSTLLRFLTPGLRPRPRVLNSTG